MISMILISVAVVLAITLGMARRSRLYQQRIEHRNRAMQVELERHRETAHSILRELQNP